MDCQSHQIPNSNIRNNDDAQRAQQAYQDSQKVEKETIISENMMKDMKSQVDPL
jgi:hypothetical protein